MVRVLAYFIWKKYLERGTFLSHLMEEEKRMAVLDRRSHAFLFELLYGTCRQKLFIENILKTFVKKKKLSSYAILTLGVYQILFMRSVTDYAAVNEMVDAARRSGLTHDAGFVNAVLRRVAEKKEKFLVPLKAREKKDYKKVSVRLSYPEWIVKKFHKQFGCTEANAILETLNRPAKVFPLLRMKRTFPSLIRMDMATGTTKSIYSPILVSISLRLWIHYLINPTL